MDSERWRQVDSLLQSVLERPPGERDAFLRQACGGDEALEREVRSLLAAQQKAGRFLESGALEMAARAIALRPNEHPSATAQIAVGSQLGPYRIEAALGAGGMGEVYQATDTRLDRLVAIKVSRAQFSERFGREARAIAALNHPHICTLYDVGPDYLVMELVTGQTLADRVAAGPIPIEEVLPIATQVAEALEAAHAKGIVHRDLKPANVKITPEGVVKVLDFGLAKLEQSASGPGDETETMERRLTEVGMVMGTAAYMSPEQARAEHVDARTDLFSLGAMLYEMATGRRAFLRALDWAPPPVDSLPTELRRIVLKLLQTDRELRYQTATDVQTDLRSWQRFRDNKQGLRRWWIAVAAALVVIACAVVAVLYWRPSHPPGRDQWVQLTHFPDSVSQPALSPDGRMLTFIRGPSTFRAPGQIYAKILPDGEAVQLTHDNSYKMSPVFSPDGSRIVYTVNGGLKWDSWGVSMLNPQPRLWLRNASGLSWLDKQRLLFSEVKDSDIHMAIVTAEENRAGARDVYVPPHIRGMAHRSYPSPDGKWVLIVEMERGPWKPCKLVSMSGSSPARQVGPPGADCTFAAWSPDGKWMYFSSAAGGAFHTWRQRFPDGPPQQITSGPTEEEGIAMAADGRSFITAVALKQSIVWVHDSNGDRQASLEGYSFDPKFAPDGKRLCYRILKDAGSWYGAGELRVVELSSGHRDPLLPGLAVGGFQGRAYDISRDGRLVVAGAPDRDGKPRLWLAALDRQSPPRQIPNVEGDSPLFGADGEILFRLMEGGSAFAYRVNQDGTGLRKAVNNVIASLRGISPDGRWLVVMLVTDAGVRTTLTAVPVTGGLPARAIFPRAALEPRLAWTPDGKFLFISIPTADSMTGLGGRTYVVPLQPGQAFPAIPAGGFQSAAEIDKLPGVRMIEGYNVAPGPTPEVYAFSRATVQRNLYRIRVP